MFPPRNYTSEPCGDTFTERVSSYSSTLASVIGPMIPILLIIAVISLKNSFCYQHYLNTNTILS